MAVAKHLFQDADIEKVEDLTGTIVLTLNSRSLADLQDDQGLVIVNLPRFDVDAVYEHARAHQCLLKSVKSKPITLRAHKFSDPNILSVVAHSGHLELLLNAHLIERLSVAGKCRLRLTGLDVAVIKHHFADQDRQTSDAIESGKLWLAWFGSNARTD